MFATSDLYRDMPAQRDGEQRQIPFLDKCTSKPDSKLSGSLPAYTDNKKPQSVYPSLVRNFADHSTARSDRYLKQYSALAEIDKDTTASYRISPICLRNELACPALVKPQYAGPAGTTGFVQRAMRDNKLATVVSTF